MNTELRLSDISAARAGDRDAFGRTVDATRNAVCSIAYAILRDVDRSEDCAQEVYLAAWQGLPKLKNPDSFLPWLRQITRYRARDFLREAGQEKQLRGGGEDAIAASADPAADARQRLVNAEDAALLEQALDAVDTETREVLVLYYREEQSMQAVSGLLGISEVAVRKRLSRAREQLRQAALDHLESCARRSAPTAALSAGVTAAIATSAPTTAAAASAAFAKGAAGASAGKLLLIAFGSLTGPIIAIGTIFFNARRELRRATDLIERAAIKRVARLNAFFTGTAAIAWACHHPFWPSNFLIVAPYFWMMGGLYWSTMVVAVRARQPRYARELALEGAVAAERHRREAKLRWIGMITGAVLGAITIVIALILRGN